MTRNKTDQDDTEEAQTEISNHEAEQIYRNLDDEEQGFVEATAYDRALHKFDEFADLETLEAANDNPNDRFEWERMQLRWEHNHDLDRDELIPPYFSDSDVADTAREFGWLFVEELREEIRSRE